MIGKLILSIQEFAGLAPMDLDDKKELQVLLSNKSFQRALGEVVRVGNEANTLTACDLKRQEGLNEALAQQGMVLGILKAVEKLIELAEVQDVVEDE
jgi:hypothetical protein